jgi:hypothetical protein
MPTISNLSFRVNFNLTGTPTLVLTDTTTSPPAGLVGIFSITQPDGYTRTGNINSPDITSAGGSFSYTLRLDSLNGLQCGTYTIVYSGNAPGYLSTDYTRTFTFQYEAPALVITEDFNVFTPLLRYKDDTVYTKAGFTNGAITRAWTAVSTPTGTKTGSSQIFDLIHNGNYYSANYTTTLTSSLTYTSSTLSWLTVSETVSKTVTSCIDAPPSVTELVSSISDLKTELDEAINTCQTYDNIKADFEYAESLFMHIIDKIKVNDMDSIFTDLNDLLSVLANHQIPACNPTNIIIPPYDLSLYSSVIWGSIGGNIANQTDVNLQNVTNNGSVTTNKITTGGVGLTGMTAGSGALYYNAAGNRVTVANYNSNGSVYFEVNGGQYTMILNPNLSVRLLGYTTNGFLKTSSSNGTLVVDTTSYISTYPAAGIAVSTGTAWGTSIVDNSANWNDAYTYRITSATSPLSITSNVISISQSSGSTNGYLSSTDWTTFNNKFDLPALTNGSVIFSNGTTLAQDNANFFWDDTNNRLGIGNSSPQNTLDVIRGTAGAMGRSTYESGSFSYNGDMKWGIYTSAAAGAGGASLMFGATNFTAGGSYPGFELQFSPSSTLSSNYMRFNSVGRNASGTVTTSVQDILSLFQAGNVAIGTSTNAGYKLDVNGTGRFQDNLLISKNQNALTGVEASNTTAQTTARATLTLTSDSGFFRISKLSTSYVAGSSNLFGGGDTLLANSTGNNLVIYNQVAGGLIRFTAGGQNASHMQLTASGRLLIGTTTENTYLLDVNGTARVTSTVTLSDLAGTGSRMVIVSATGVLSSQAITTGTVTSVDMSVPTGFAISGNPVTSTGTLALAFASGYSLPTNVKQSNWDDAYTWVSGFPSQTGNGGKYLTTDGSTLSWGDSIPGFESSFLLMGA